MIDFVVFILEIDGWREFIMRDFIVNGGFIIVVGEWNRMKYNDVVLYNMDDCEAGCILGDDKYDTDDDVFV